MPENLNKINEALSRAQAEIKHAILDCTNPHFKSKYASLTSVQDAYKKALEKHGFALIQKIITEGNDYFIETCLLHNSGENITSRFKLLVDKPTMQGLGSAITYGRRYGVSALLGIVDTEDDDGNAASQKPKQKPTGDEHEKMKVGKYTGKTMRETLEIDSSMGFVLAKWVASEMHNDASKLHECYKTYLKYAYSEGFEQ